MGLVVPRGQTGSLRVEAAGTHTLSYQWRKDGFDIPNAIGSTLTLTNAARAMTGTYSVIVSNSVGIVRSESADFRVLVPQHLQLPQRATNGNVQLLFSDQTSGLAADLTRFEVHYTTNFLAANTAWITNSGGLVISNGMVLFNDTTSGNGGRRFYRIIEK